ncbi:MAG: M15 family metallopeptidase [Thiohalorhabdus sp.]|uniref:M15 family metallopeptidase n=1 Tax=Thiohalorhabdus sp. TaxID=3094134 RepID=UPI00397ED95A
MASRDLEDLAPAVRGPAQLLEQKAEAQGLELLIYCTYRSPEEQARLYRKGRSYADIEAKAEELEREHGRQDLGDLLLQVGPQEGGLVTYAGPGQSIHNYRMAFDAVPLEGGKPVWSTSDEEDRELWEMYGELVREVGLEWAGDWTSFTEFPHAQAPDADWRELIKA